MDATEEKTTPRPVAETQIAVTFEQIPMVIGKAFSNPHLLRMEDKGEFPRRIYLGPKTPVWYVSELRAWFEAKAAEAREIHPAIPERKPRDQWKPRKDSKKTTAEL
jgi:predicted DNA-binding transcriptional regulator AlpA